ncbi:MAG: PAS domain S-box protein [Burkholderiales bacterium]|nr:PAS domain S-box protein [Burkholderiales bacterium]
MQAIGRVWGDLSGLLNSMTLTARVVLLVVSLFVAGIWALALSTTAALERDLTQLLSANFSSEATNVASDLDRDVRLYVDTLARLAESLSPDILADPVKADHALDKFADSSAIVPHDCFVTDANGTIIAGYPTRLVQVGASIKDLGYFRNLLATGKPVIGEPAPEDTAQSKPAMAIAVPLRDGAGAIVGALVGSVLLSDPLSFGQIEKLRVGRTGWFLVVSPTDRRILASTDRRRVGAALPGHGIIPLLDRRFEHGYEGAEIVQASIGTQVLSVGRKMETTGWFVIASNPTSEMFAPIASLKRHIYLAALLISLAAALILRFFLARQLAPLAQAGRAMRRMTSGELPMAAIPVARQDEIGELIADFNMLVEERGRLDRSLQAEIISHRQSIVALRDSTERLDGIYQSVGEGIVSTDSEQRIVLFNAAAEKIFGYTADEIIGQHVNVLLPERFRERHVHQVADFNSGGLSQRRMGTYGLIYGLRASGEEFPLEASVSQSGTAANKLLTVILRDITERRQAEEVREQLVRQLESLGGRLAAAQEDERREIAYELHEELGQELATLKLYLQMSQSGSSGSEAAVPHKEALAMAAHATERVRRLVLDLEPLELTQLGLYAAVRGYSQRQAAAGGWKLHVEAPKPDVRPARAVERACFRLLQEGLRNVLEHSNASEVWIDLRQWENTLELSIRDNGVGFDCDASGGDEGREGANLGLLGMQIRAKQAGGSVQIRSAAGAGTEVLAVFDLRTAAIEPV